jgi:hypothetical protein
MKISRPISQLLFTILSIIVFASCKPKVRYETGTLSDIFEIARKENKKVFILIGDSTCTRCAAFAEFIDTLPGIADALNKDYISYKVDLHDPQQKVAGQIFKTSSVPFPYFLDANGKILAFGFPNSLGFKIDNLDSIYIDEYKFREIFQLNISKYRYTQMVYYSLNAYLEAQAIPQKKGTLTHALELAQKSVEIGLYPYNLYQVYSFSRRSGLNELADSYQQKLVGNYTSKNKFLYASMMNGIGLSGDLFAEAPAIDRADLIFDSEELVADKVVRGSDLHFTFHFTNTSSLPIKIEKVEHQCTCIEFSWPLKEILPFDTGSICGIYHTSEVGPYDKEIFVHMNSGASFKTVHLKGIVL